MEADLNPWIASSFEVKSVLKSLVNCNEDDRWKLSLLENYLKSRQELEEKMEPTEDNTELINSLCST